jgi:siroheme synthase
LPEQRALRGTLATIAASAREARVTAPALLIVGDVTTFTATDALLGSDARKDGSMSHGAYV